MMFEINRNPVQVSDKIVAVRLAEGQLFEADVSPDQNLTIT
jgi:hypothetical protein